MLKKIRRKLKKHLLYLRAIKGNSAFLCIKDEWLQEGKLRRITIGETTLLVRTNTPDLDVAISSLFKKEYDHIRSSSIKSIIDAGANIGTSALFFARKYPDATIVSIEPEEENFELLKKNLGSYPNVILIKAAIWGTHEKRTIQNRFTGHWGYTISETDNDSESTGQEINCITIEDIMENANLDHIDLLKMDIEGGEKNVLEHSANWIDSVSIITIELHDRICQGCRKAFDASTKDFKTFEKHGEKVTAYRE